jgi:hypothetical protein
MNLPTLCTPALIYFVISLILLIVNSIKGFNIISFLTKGLFIILWSLLLNFICNMGLSIVSWILVFLPFITMFI